MALGAQRIEVGPATLVRDNRECYSCYRGISGCCNIDGRIPRELFHVAGLKTCYANSNGHIGNPRGASKQTALSSHSRRSTLHRPAPTSAASTSSTSSAGRRGMSKKPTLKDIPPRGLPIVHICATR